MRLQVTLVLFCMFFTTALAVKCNQCTSKLDLTSSGSCSPTTQVNCTDQCISVTSSFYVFGGETDVTMKTCGMPEKCVSQSLNFGSVQVTTNAKCCSTDLCNNKTLPVLTQQDNGKVCYACEEKNCSKTVNCRGIEDFCISAKDSSKSFWKGCASQSVCEAVEFNAQGELVFEEIFCCEGDLCNGAETFTLSFLILLVPLLSSILLH